jgi:hypothetical protein
LHVKKFEPLISDRSAPGANPGYDAEDADGTRYQIKEQFISNYQWTGFNKKSLENFGVLICVLYDDNGDVSTAHLVCGTVAREKAFLVPRKCGGCISKTIFGKAKGWRTSRLKSGPRLKVGRLMRE